MRAPSSPHARRVALVVSLALCVGCSMRASPPLDDPDALLDDRSREVIGHDLGQFARAGVAVRLSLTARPPLRRTPSDAWFVALGPWGVAVEVPWTLAGRVSPEVARATVERWSGPFLQTGRLSEAAQTSLWGLREFVRRAVRPSFEPLLPPVYSPPPLVTPSPESTAWWGVPLALVGVLVASILGRRARVHKSATEPPQ